MVTRVPLAPPPPLPLLLQEEAPSPGRPWRTPRTRALGARKHKMEAQPEGAPLPKKRLTEDEAAAMEDPCAVAAVRTLGPPSSAPEEEMEDAPGESQEEEEEEEEDAARRRLREIEARIIDEEEEEEEVGRCGGRPEEVDAAGLSGGRPGAAGLPTLVLSDTLKTGLRRDFEGGLTKKIIESMSRPSMELVLWKPLPGFLSEPGAKMAAASLKAFGTSAERGPQKPERTLGGPQFGSQHTPERTPTHPPPPPLLLYGNADPAGGPSTAEEEMEL